MQSPVLSRSINLLATALLVSMAAPVSAQEQLVETYTGIQSIDLIMPGERTGSQIRFDGTLRFTSLSFTPGSVMYQGQPFDLSGREFCFTSTTFNITLWFPDLPGQTVDASGLWSILGIQGSLLWRDIELGSAFSESSFDVVPFSAFKSIVLGILWQQQLGSCVPQLVGSVVDLDGTHNVQSINPATGLMSVDASGLVYAEPSGGVGVPTEVAPRVRLSSYPNPFLSHTSLEFSLDAPAFVSLRIYDLRGAPVDGLWMGPLGASSHRMEWHGRNQQGERVPSGLYWARLQAGTAVSTIRILRLN